VNGSPVTKPSSSAFAINSLASNIFAAKPNAQKEVSWSKPLPGILKLNTDASHQSDGSGGAGAVLRNHKGEVLGGMFCPLSNVQYPASAEALALLKGLNFLKSIDCNRVLIESDSLELV
jgi:hypothetical protein